MEEKDKLTSIQQYFRQNSILIAIFCILQFFIIVIVIFLVSQLNKEESRVPSLTIANFASSIKNLPSESVEPIQIALYNVVNQNNNNIVDDMDVVIRENSYVNQYFERQKIHYVNLIVDIPTLEQSFQIFHEWPEKNDYANQYYMINRATMAMCVTPEDTIYHNSTCEDAYWNNGQRAIAAEFIKYFTFDYFNAYAKEYELYKTIYISPIHYDHDENEKESFIEKTKDAIKSLGISPEIFDYHVLEEDEIDYFIPVE
ncbi:hypothetical protein IKD98_00105 [Candidatus Saccharibacteria bacterium]|nr:hypothetical protein [Candidatus Saccharibacteria bacterium]